MMKNKMIVNSRKTGSAQNWMVSVTVRYTLVDQQGLDKTKSGREKNKKIKNFRGKKLYERK